MTWILPIFITERRHRVASCVSEMGGLSLVCVLFSDIHVKASCKEIFLLSVMYLNPPAFLNLHTLICTLVHTSVCFLHATLSFLIVSRKKKSLGMKTHHSFLNNMRSLTPLGGRFVGCSLQSSFLPLCVLFCFVFSSQRACPFTVTT